MTRDRGQMRTSKQQQVVVLLAGASGGVGRAVAREYGAWGARVALLARGAQGLSAAAAEVRVAGGQPLVIPVDVADPEQVQAGTPGAATPVTGRHT